MNKKHHSYTFNQDSYYDMDLKANKSSKQKRLCTEDNEYLGFDLEDEEELKYFQEAQRFLK